MQISGGYGLAPNEIKRREKKNRIIHEGRIPSVLHFHREGTVAVNLISMEVLSG